MKKVLAVIALSTTLGACGTKTIIKEVAPSTIAPVVTQAPYDMYDQYLTYVQDNAPAGYPYTQEEAIKIGDTVCQAFDSGLSSASIIKVLEDSAGTQADIKMYAVVLVGAVNYLCPEYRSALQA